MKYFNGAEIVEEESEPMSLAELARKYPQIGFAYEQFMTMMARGWVIEKRGDRDYVYWEHNGKTVEELLRLYGDQPS